MSMDCPTCDTPGLEIGSTEIYTQECLIEVHFATCNTEIGHDPPYGCFSYMCDFFLVRESHKLVVQAVQKKLDEIERKRNTLGDTFAIIQAGRA